MSVRQGTLVPPSGQEYCAGRRDYVAEKTNHPREVVKAARAVQSKIEAAYRLADLFERRGRVAIEGDISRTRDRAPRPDWTCRSL